MIVRVLRATVRPGRVGAFNALFRRQVAMLHEQPGLLYVKLARRLHADGSQEAVLFEEWEDAGSLYRWVGPNLTEPRLIPGIRELVDDVSVAHYESLAEDGDAMIEGDALIDDAPATAAGGAISPEPSSNGGRGPDVGRPADDSSPPLTEAAS